MHEHFDLREVGLPYIRILRALQGLTLRKVADAAGISPSYLMKIETGITPNPSPRVLYRLSLALNHPYADFFKMAGYEIPVPAEDDPTPLKLQSALGATSITNDEAEILAAVIREVRLAKLQGVVISPEVVQQMMIMIRQLAQSKRPPSQ